LSCVGTGLRQGGSPVQGVLPTAYSIHNSGLILVRNSTESVLRKVEEEEEEEEEERKKEKAKLTSVYT
jgi:hypothetical protein